MNEFTNNAPNFILEFASGVMRFYPWIMRVSWMLNRLIQ